MWYSNLYRRHLTDMHVEDDKEIYLSEFSVEKYIENLKKCKANYAMIPLQSHVGLCHYPTKSGVTHRHFAENPGEMKRLIGLCHENGIKVIAYYSLIFNTREHDRRPKWRMITDNGQSKRERGDSLNDAGQPFTSKQQSRYGLVCPHNKEYFEFVKAQINEILEYCSPDGLFFDMPFWPWPSICYCDDCKKRWAKEVGGEIPIAPSVRSEIFDVLSRKRYQWMGEWAKKVTDYVKEIAPSLVVYHNGASLVAGSSNLGTGVEVNEACDFCGGDLYGDVFNQSFTCKLYKNITKNAPFEYMISRCKPSLRAHTMTKTLDEIKTAVAITASHHGATLVMDAIDPVGTMDERVYNKIGEAFDMQIPYEPYFRGTMTEDVGIYYGIRSKIDFMFCGKTSINGCTDASRMLIRNHIPFGVTGCFYRLERYKAIIAPLLLSMESDDNKRICEYVRNGGVIYLNGIGNKELIEKLTGGKIGNKLLENRVYIAPKPEYEDTFLGFNAKYPLPYDGVTYEIKGIDEDDVAATFTMPYTKSTELAFASIHSDPPGVETNIPAVVCKKYGKGTVIWSSMPLECGESEEYGDIVLSLVSRFADLSKPSFETNAPGNVEITLFENEGEMLVNCTLMTIGYKAFPVSPFKIRVKCEKAKTVTLLPENTTIDFKQENGYIEFETRSLNIFDMYRIEM